MHRQNNETPALNALKALRGAPISMGRGEIPWSCGQQPSVFCLFYFKQAVRWEIIARNPFDNVILPKTEYKKRDIWTADIICTALDQCTDGKLYVAMNLAFACEPINRYTAKSA